MKGIRNWNDEELVRFWKGAVVLIDALLEYEDIAGGLLSVDRFHLHTLLVESFRVWKEMERRGILSYLV